MYYDPQIMEAAIFSSIDFLGFVLERLLIYHIKIIQTGQRVHQAIAYLHQYQISQAFLYRVKALKVVPVQIEIQSVLREFLKNWRAVHDLCLLAILFFCSSALDLQSQQYQHIPAYPWLVIEYSRWNLSSHNTRCINPYSHGSKFALDTWFPKSCHQLINSHLK